MVNSSLVRYLKEGIKQGFSFFELKHNLIAKGWPEDDIDLAWAELSGGVSSLGKGYSYHVKTVFLFGSLLFLIIFGIILFVVFNNTETVFSKEDIGSGKSFDIVRKPVKILLDEGEADIYVEETFSNYTKTKINNKGYRFNVSQSREFDLNSDGTIDLSITLERIKSGIPRFYAEKVSIVKEQVNESINSS